MEIYIFGETHKSWDSESFTLVGANLHSSYSACHSECFGYSESSCFYVELIRSSPVFKFYKMVSLQWMKWLLWGVASSSPASHEYTLAHVKNCMVFAQNGTVLE